MGLFIDSFFHGRVLEIVMFAINRTSARRTQGELSRFTSMAHINGTHVLSLLTFITSKLGSSRRMSSTAYHTSRIVWYRYHRTCHNASPTFKSLAVSTLHYHSVRDSLGHYLAREGALRSSSFQRKNQDPKSTKHPIKRRFNRKNKPPFKLTRVARFAMVGSKRG
jgi:hypothetical protein